MGMTDDDDTVYCDIQMPLAQGRELLLLVTTLRESNAHPTLNRIFERIEDELSTSIDIIEDAPGASNNLTHQSSASHAFIASFTVAYQWSSQPCRALATCLLVLPSIQVGRGSNALENMLAIATAYLPVCVD